MNIFQKVLGNLAKKAIQYTYMTNYGKAYWKTGKDTQYITEAYNKIVWVYSCVSLIASCTSSVEFCLYKKLNNKIYEIEDHPILNMVNNKANSYTTSKDFLDIWSTYLALQGKFYAVFNRNKLPSEIEFIYPQYTRVIPGKEDFYSGVEYDIGGEKYIYEKDLVIWSKFFDPLDDYCGLSPIKALARTIDTENEAVDWNKTALQNSAVPPGAIQIFNPGPTLQAKLDSEWHNRYAGSGNVRKPLILDAEKASYTNFGLSPIDMDFMLQRKTNRIEICSGFGVPSQLVGDPEGQTYANYKEANKAFWENTIIPRYAMKILSDLNLELCTKFNDNYYLDIDYDKIQALQESREIINKTANENWESGLIKRSEARAMLGYEFDKSDDVYVTDLKSQISKTNYNINTGNKKDIDNDFDDKKKVYY